MTATKAASTPRGRIVQTQQLAVRTSLLATRAAQHKTAPAHTFDMAVRRTTRVAARHARQLRLARPAVSAAVTPHACTSHAHQHQRTTVLGAHAQARYGSTLFSTPAALMCGATQRSVFNAGGRRSVSAWIAAARSPAASGAIAPGASSPVTAQSLATDEDGDTAPFRVLYGSQTGMWRQARGRGVPVELV